MFKAVQFGHQLEQDPRRIVALQRSANTVTMALGPGPARPVRAWIVSFFDPSGSYRVYVFLGVSDRDPISPAQGMLFRSEPEDVALAQYEGLQREAAQMVRSQGFQMERLEFQTADDATRAAWAWELPIAGQRMEPPSNPSGARPSLGDLNARLAPVTSTAPVPEISREISLPSQKAMEVLGRLLALF